MESSVSVFDDVVPTPFPFVDIAKVHANVLAVGRAAADLGISLRPHVKTHKLAALARMQLEEGAVGLTVAKIGEAEAFLRAGITTSYLVAQPFWSSNQVDRFLALQKHCTAVASVDSTDLARRLSEAAVRASISVELSLIVDTGYGRFGVHPDAARRAARGIAALPSISLTGTRSHAGHAYGVSDPAARREIVSHEVGAMNAVADELRADGHDLKTVSVGCTPGLPPLLELGETGSVNEIRPGNYVFFDRQQHSMGVAPLERCALSIVTTVVSRPARHVAILDAGKMTLSSTPDPLAPGFGLISQYPDAIVSTLSQECATVETAGADLPVGTRVSLIPNHACEITNLASDVYYGADNRIHGAWHPEAASCTS